MAKWIWLLSAAFVAAPSTTWSAKPGDLPVDISQQCPEGYDGPPRDPGHTVMQPTVDSMSVVFPREARCPRDAQREDLPRFVHQLRDVAEAAVPQGEHRVRRDPLENRPYDAAAQTLFYLAEQCRRDGDFARARTCYEEAHLISPTSHCGRLAIDRLRALDHEQFAIPTGDAEEAEAPAPRDSGRQRSTSPRQGEPTQRKPQQGTSHLTLPFEEMLHTTVPLGGVER